MTSSGNNRLGDGRRNNKPPVEHQIQPGEVRNPYGRKGKKGQEDIPSLGTMDLLYKQEAARIVSYDRKNPVTAQLRLVQEEFHDALMKGDQAARIRVLNQLFSSTDRDAQYVASVQTRKIQLIDEFYQTQIARRRPPDILPHPAHVHIINGEVTILGPITRAERKWWEIVKSSIKVLACLHKLTRRRYRRNPCEMWLKNLKNLEAQRRKIMRMVPKGWNWKEEIRCRDDQSKWLEEQMSLLRALEEEFEDA